MIVRCTRRGGGALSGIVVGGVARYGTERFVVCAEVATTSAAVTSAPGGLTLILKVRRRRTALPRVRLEAPLLAWWLAESMGVLQEQLLGRPLVPDRLRGEILSE